MAVKEGAAHEIAALRRQLYQQEIRNERRVRELEAALKHYTYCRHACIDCFCTKEARNALNGGSVSG